MKILYSVTFFNLIFGYLGCATLSDVPALSVFAPSKVAKTFIPHGEIVDSPKVKKLTLKEILIFADSHSPFIQNKKMSGRIVSADLVEAQLFLKENPEIQFSIATRTRGETRVIDFEFGIEQKFNISGKRASEIKAAKAKQKLAASSLAEVRWQVHVEIHRLFVDLLLVRERKIQAQRFIDFSRSLKKIAMKKVGAGESPPLILSIAEADLAQTQEAFIEAEEKEEMIRNAIARVAGWATVLPTLHGDLPATDLIPTENVLLKLMEENHPILRSGELRVGSAVYNYELEGKKAWPEPTIGVSYGHENVFLESGDVGLWQVRFSLPISLWDRNQGGRARANAKAWFADSQRTTTILRLRVELKNALLRFKMAEKRKRIYLDDILPKLKNNVNHLSRAFELGEVDIHQVSQAQEKLLNATARHLNTRIQYYEAAVELGGLIGTEIFEVDK